MKKFLMYFLLLFSLTSCFSQENNENIGVVENKINTENLEKKELQSTWLLEGLWENKKEITENFYSNNPERQKLINEWLSDEKNQRTSASWDVLEFLNYCENLKKEVTNVKELLAYLYKVDKKWYEDIFGTTSINMDDLDIKTKIFDSLKNSDNAWAFYKNMFEDFFENKSLDCSEYVK